jgi:monothiol bacilliredoxin
METTMDRTRAFTPIADLDALEAAIADSHAAPVIVFNHDPSCPISAFAYEQMTDVAGAVRLIDVARQRDVSRDIAQRTGVRHESPQVIVLRDGRAAWSASHFDITTAAVAGAVAEVT